MKFPNVKEELILSAEDLKMWSLVSTHAFARRAYDEVFGLNHMPFDNMPMEEGKAICFMRGGTADELIADAILFMGGAWHHIQIQIVRVGQGWRLAAPGVDVEI